MDQPETKDTALTRRFSRYQVHFRPQTRMAAKIKTPPTSPIIDAVNSQVHITQKQVGQTSAHMQTLFF